MKLPKEDAVRFATLAVLVCMLSSSDRPSAQPAPAVDRASEPCAALEPPKKLEAKAPVFIGVCRD